MGDADVTFRHVLRALPRPILHLAFPGHQFESVGPVDASVDRTRQRTVDNLFRVRDGEVEAVVHVEIEREWRKQIPHRLFDYASAAVTATRLPIGSVVVLLKRGGDPPRGIGVHRTPGVGCDAFVFCYHVVPLWELDARSMRASLGLEAAPFCVAMRGADEACVRSLAEEVLADHSLTEGVRQSTIQLLFIVSSVILGIDIARRIFHVESIMQDPNVQALINEWADLGRAKGQVEGRKEGLQEGRQEGLRDGLKEGRNEGRNEEARRALYEVLAARSFPVTADVRARIDGEPNLLRLQSWHRASVTAAAIGDVFRDE